MSLGKVRIVKNWDWPDLMRQTPNQKGIWDGIEFTIEPIETCDFLVVLNNCMLTDTHVKCPKNNVWAIMQEPYEKGFTDWMVEKHECFSKVLTHHLPSDSRKYIPSHPAIPWHVNKTFDQLISTPKPEKTKNLSWIVGDAMDLPGHIKRWSFLNFIQKDGELDLDLYGKAINYIEDKWDGLAPYRYSLAIENNSGPNCWTEKLADCFLAWSVPIYYGCTNLNDYFPEESFISIDIDQPERSLEKIKRIICEDNWEKRIPYLEEARKLVLYRYQLFPYLSKLINSHLDPSAEKVSVTIPRYKRSIKASLYHLKFKLMKKMKKLTF
jgi:hypothetical protein